MNAGAWVMMGLAVLGIVLLLRYCDIGQGGGYVGPRSDQKPTWRQVPTPPPRKKETP